MRRQLGESLMEIADHIATGTSMRDAKFLLNRSPNAPVSSAELLADLRRAAETAGTNRLGSRLYPEYGMYSVITVSKRFGSWNKALKEAGLEIANEVNISDERLFENMMVLWEQYGRQPKRRESAQLPSKISERPYSRRF